MHAFVSALGACQRPASLDVRGDHLNLNLNLNLKVRVSACQRLASLDVRGDCT